MELECTRTHAHIDAHVHARASSRQAGPGSAGEAYWELWGWTEASLSCSAGGAPLRHYNPVIITNTLRRLFARTWAYVAAIARACLEGVPSHTWRRVQKSVKTPGAFAFFV